MQATVLFTLVVATMAAALLYAASRAHSTARLALILGAHLAITGTLAASGLLTPAENAPPRLMLLPPLAFTLGLALLRSPAGRRSLAALPAWAPVAGQAMRIPIEVVLWLLLLDGRVPVQMTFEGMNYDILVGLSAPLVAWRLARGGVGAVRLARAWNVLALVPLVTIIVVSVLSAPGPQRVFMNAPGNTFVATLPFIWLPAFLVPLAGLLHVAAWMRLREARVHGAAVPSGAVTSG
jgi:hypothetical protein